jgi:Uncharacterized protein conserved in bacteria (DUF2066)
MASSRNLLYDRSAVPTAANISDRRRFAMALGLVTAVPGKRARRPLACAFLAWLMMLMPLAPGAAEEPEGAFSATVKVDATADTAAAAREAARIDGQRRALAAVIERLSGPSENAKPPKLDDKAITDMVDSFEVANERMSAVRYVAEYTFHFRPSKVRRLVRVAESAAAESVAKSTTDNAAKSSAEGGGNRAVVVLPLYKDAAGLALWDDPNPWRAAWAQRSVGPGSTRLILPLGDAKDLAAVDAEKAAAGKSDALNSIAQRNGGAEAIVALATARQQDGKLAGLEVGVKRYRGGRLIDTQGSSFDAEPGEGEADLLRRTAEAVAAIIENSLKKSAGARSDQQASLSVAVPITSLGEWLQVRDRLASVPSIRKVDLLSLTRQEARIEIKYIGSQDQLKSGLAEVNLDLGGGGSIFRIQPSGPASSR